MEWRLCKAFCEIAKSKPRAAGLPEAITLLKVLFWSLEADPLCVHVWKGNESWHEILFHCIYSERCSCSLGQGVTKIQTIPRSQLSGILIVKIQSAGAGWSLPALESSQDWKHPFTKYSWDKGQLRLELCYESTWVQVQNHSQRQVGFHCFSQRSGQGGLDRIPSHSPDSLHDLDSLKMPDLCVSLSKLSFTGPGRTQLMLE